MDYTETVWCPKRRSPLQPPPVAASNQPPQTYQHSETPLTEARADLPGNLHNFDLIPNNLLKDVRIS